MYESDINKAATVEQKPIERKVISCNGHLSGVLETYKSKG